jgi:uncharacterized protein YndB with AHSA1/START domain
MPQTIRLYRVFRAPSERVYRAFLEPAALVKWSPPNGFTATVHHSDVRVGGGYRMSFTNFASGRSHTFGGTYHELEPGRRIRYDDAFDDPTLPGTMTVTVEFRDVPAGTEVRITQEGVPDAVPADGCHLGWQQSLALLAALVETEVPDP